MGVIVRVAAGLFPCSCSRPQNRVIMSMQPQPWPEVPAGTARVAKRAFRLGALAAAAPGWLAGVIDASWQEVYGQRIDDFRLPDSKAKRADLAVQYGRD